MKAARLLLRLQLKNNLPDGIRIDRYNQQYRNTDTEAPVDWDKGGIFIEFANEVPWETLGDGLTQEGDAEIRVHVCRTYYGDTHADNDKSNLDVMDLPEEVFKIMQQKPLTDSKGRTIATAFMRVGSLEDNDHDGLEIDIISFSTRLTDYSAADARDAGREETNPTLNVMNDQDLGN